MRIVFAGTPEVAVASVAALAAAGHEVVAVLTRPDARRGRGRQTGQSPVKEWAVAHGVPVLQPVSLKDDAVVGQLAELAPDCCPVVAYGGLIPKAVRAVPRHGWVNLHFSLLPAWRGAAPVQHAIMAGDEVTGASTFLIERGLDTGPVFGTVTHPIGARDTAGDVLGALAVTGAELLVRTLAGLADGSVTGVPQPGEGVSLAPRLEAADAEVVWDRPAVAVDRLIRGCTPAPGAWTWWGEQRLKLGPVSLGAESGLAPGEVAVEKHRVLVGAARGCVVLGEVQPPGKRMMAAVDWVRGARMDSGAFLGENPTQ